MVELDHFKIHPQSSISQHTLRAFLHFQLKREDIPVSKRLRAAFMVNTDKEYMFGLNYILTKNIGVGAHYNSDMGIGVGLKLNY